MLRSDVWRTIRIVAAEDGPATDGDRRTSLQFTSVGRSARVEQMINSTQRDTIDQLVRSAIHNPYPDEQLLNTIYELIVPNTLKEQGYGAENLMLLVDAEAGALPLEMMAMRTDDQRATPMCVEVGVVRRLETRKYSEIVRPAAGRAGLVIGDPTAGRGIGALRGARAEAHAVAEQLRKCGYDVTTIIAGDDAEPPDLETIYNAIFRRDYRVIHIAGHGVYSDKPTESGVIIGDKGEVLTALELGKMRTTPDLVFLNCCHVGTVAPKANELASSLSQTLITNGVKAVVAAGWAVTDGDATAFAERFYREFLTGANLGQAALEARKAIYRESDPAKTWGAYQVYGPPAYRMGESGRSSRRAAAPVAKRELVDALDELFRQGRTASAETGAAIAQELDELLRSVPAVWQEGRVLAKLGELHTQLALYADAVTWHQKLVDDEGGSASLKIIERLANARAKWAVELHKAGRWAEALEQVDEAEKKLKLILELRETTERRALLGSVARRRAYCSEGEERTKAFTEARDAYREAALGGGREDESVAYYPAINAAVLDVVVAARTQGEPSTELGALTKLVHDARVTALRQEPPDYWSRVTAADADLALALVNRTLDHDYTIEKIALGYAVAFEESCPSERATVVEALENLECAFKETELDPYVGQLEEIRKRLSV